MPGASTPQKITTCYQKKSKKHQFKDSQSGKKLLQSYRFDALSDDESIDMQTSYQNVSDNNCSSNTQQNRVPPSPPTTSNITKKTKYRQ
ncbi:hypothetical protein NPIL_259401 [Nephila pilipes]|uniref:Uncharacterized protein n=1 Tax=Nephila pilipes TaxID=299642 RepID=A0A8X6URZ4_NEPPI|nr:hypothetical protein NPIL_259401 [Nephila pilipes]